MKKSVLFCNNKLVLYYICIAVIIFVCISGGLMQDRNLVFADEAGRSSRDYHTHKISNSVGFSSSRYGDYIDQEYYDDMVAFL